MKRLGALVAAVFISACAGNTSPSASSPASGPSVPPRPSAATTPKGAPSAAALKPGEPWLIYGGFPEGLYLVRTDGSDGHRVDIGHDGVPFGPSWSADGERIVFVMKDAATPDGSIWTADANGSHARKLYGYEPDGCNLGAYWPVWAPDGRRLALLCYHGSATDALTSISVLDTTTMKRTDLVTFRGPETTDNPPSWSPDGTMLTFEIIHWDPTGQFLDPRSWRRSRPLAARFGA